MRFQKTYGDWGLYVHIMFLFSLKVVALTLNYRRKSVVHCDLYFTLDSVLICTAKAVR